MVQLKRAYEPASPADGKRILVDRLWPRGVSKEEARIDSWEKDLAPSTELRKWFGHDPAKWKEFQTRYVRELSGRKAELKALAEEAHSKTVTLVYAAKDEEHNDAVVLKRLIEGETG